MDGLSRLDIVQRAAGAAAGAIERRQTFYAPLPFSGRSVTQLGNPQDGTSAFLIVDEADNFGVQLTYFEAAGKWYSAPFLLIQQLQDLNISTAGAETVSGSPYFSLAHIPKFGPCKDAGLRLAISQGGLIGTTAGAGDAFLDCHLFGVNLASAVPFQDLGIANIPVSNAGTLAHVFTGPDVDLFAVPTDWYTPSLTYRHAVLYPSVITHVGTTGLWRSCQIFGRWEGTP